MQVAKYFCDRCKKEIPSVMDVEHGKAKEIYEVKITKKEAKNEQ